jgi:hypothetical protein
MLPLLFNENYQSFLIQFDEWIDFSHTHPSLNHLIFSLTKATEYSTPCLISFFEKIETHSSQVFFFSPYSTRARGNKWDMLHSQQIREGMWPETA